MEFHPEGIMGSRELTHIFPWMKKLLPTNKNVIRNTEEASEGDDRKGGS